MGNNNSQEKITSFEVPDNITNATLSNTKKFDSGINNKRLVAKVIEVIDGDTLTVALAINNGIYSIRIRVYGVDTPELRPKRKYSNDPKVQEQYNKERELEKNNAVKATEYVTSLVIDRIVILKSYTLDNFGRLIAEVFIPSKNEKVISIENCQNLSTLLLENKYAIPYQK